VKVTDPYADTHLAGSPPYGDGQEPFQGSMDFVIPRGLTITLPGKYSRQSRFWPYTTALSVARVKTEQAETGGAANRQRASTAAALDGKKRRGIAVI
jgi:hypothetical protein